MRFFFRSKDDTRPIEKTKEQRSAYKVSMTSTDYSDLEENTVTLKVWIPESIEQRLDEVTSYLNTSLSDLIRQILFQHLYGRYDLIGLVERQKHEQEGPYDGVQFSAKTPVQKSAPPIQKKVAGLKVYIPERMRRDLEKLAGEKYQTISEYARTVIMIHLFGVLNSPNIISSSPDSVEE